MKETVNIEDIESIEVTHVSGWGDGAIGNYVIKYKDGI